MPRKKPKHSHHDINVTFKVWFKIYYIALYNSRPIKRYLYFIKSFAVQGIAEIKVKCLILRKPKKFSETCEI